MGWTRNLGDLRRVCILYTISVIKFIKIFLNLFFDSDYIRNLIMWRALGVQKSTAKVVSYSKFYLKLISSCV